MRGLGVPWKSLVLMLTLAAGAAWGQGPVRIEFEPAPAAEPDLFARIDGGFAAAVDAMASVLFYPVFAEEQQYLQLNHVEHYVRSSGEDVFQRHDPRGSYESDALTEAEVQALGLRGKLIAREGENVRQATLDGQPVEVVSIVMDDASTYVWVPDDGLFRKQQAMRALLSTEPEDALSESEAEELATLGRLVGSDGESPEAWRQVRQVNGAPVVVLWLAGGAVFFTFYMQWVNVWGFRHALDVVRGSYDNPDEPGEVTHFQALASALSATVGLGNIAGVTIAISMGGPGAFFWMMAFGVFGMTSKFVECTLGQKYRRVKPDGTVLGGPMQYLHRGLEELGLGPLGFALSIVFAVMCILASFGGGNMFQANQSGSVVLTILQENDRAELTELQSDIVLAAESGDLEQVEPLREQQAAVTARMLGFEKTFRIVYGILLAAMVAVVIIGGIRRIGAAAEKVVPTMCIVYVSACLWIIVMHLGQIPGLIQSVFSEAFSGQAFGGGFLGVLVLGVRRAAFSNEAGVGSAAIAHSAAKTEEPVREGAVALLGPFIDTIVVCSMTALVMLITGAWDNEEWIVQQGLQGAALTSVAFKGEISWFPYVLAIAVVLFAYSTIISWSYYGERCWERLFGLRSTMVYKAIYVACVFVGAIAHLGAVLDFSDMMILSMAFPNVLGCVLLAPKVKRDLADYWQRFKNNEFKRFKD